MKALGYMYNRVVVLQQVISHVTHGPLFSSGQKRKKSNMKRGPDIILGNWGEKGGRTKHDIEISRRRDRPVKETVPQDFFDFRFFS
jgi:hypothetical protein